MKYKLFIIMALMFFIALSINAVALKNSVYYNNFTVEADFNNDWFAGSCKVMSENWQSMPKAIWSSAKVGTSDSTEKWAYHNLTSDLQLNNSEWEIVLNNYPTGQVGSSSPDTDWTGIQISNGTHGFASFMNFGHKSALQNRSIVYQSNVSNLSQVLSVINYHNSIFTQTPDFLIYGQWQNKTIYIMNSSRSILTTTDSANYTINKIDCIAVAARWKNFVEYVNITTSQDFFTGDIKIFNISTVDNYNINQNLVYFNFTVNSTQDFYCDLIINDTINKTTKLESSANYSAYFENFTSQTDFNNDWHAGGCKNVGYASWQTKPKATWYNADVGTSSTTERWAYHNLTTPIQLDTSSSEAMWKLRLSELNYVGGFNFDWVGYQISNGSHGFFVSINREKASTGRNLILLQKLNETSAFTYYNTNYGSDVITPEYIDFYQKSNGTLYIVDYLGNILTTNESDLILNNITCISVSARMRGAVPNFNLTYNINEQYNYSESAGNNTHIYFNQTFQEGIYNWTIQCFSNVTNTTSAVRDFLVDATDPMIVNITIDNQTSLNGIDATRILYENRTYNYNFTFADDNLYAIRFQWWNGTYFKNYTAISGTYRNVTFKLNRYDLNLFTPGVYWFNYSVSDGHTAKSIEDYNVSKNPLTKGITFNDKVTVTPLGITDMTSSFKAEKEDDRYVFVYEKKGLEKIMGKEDFKFEVKSDYYIDILDKSKYPAHMVILDANKWTDFKINSKTAKYKITRKAFNKVEVEITGLKENKLIFESIGELNTITDTYYFMIVNSTVTYTPEVIANGLQSIILDVDVFNRSLLQYTNSTLIYNNTDYYSYVTKSMDGTHDIYNATFYTQNVTGTNQTVQFYWGINVTGNDSTIYTFNTNQTNQTIYDLTLYDCDAYNGTKVLTFNGITEEHDQVAINYSMNIWTNITFGPSDFVFTKGFNFSGKSSYSICIPLNMTSINDYTIDAIIEYSSDNNSLSLDFVDRKYYIVNMPLNNTESTINLYLLDETRSTDVVLNVLDKITGEGIPNTYIKILRFYPENGNYLTVEIEKTDTTGQTLGKMVLADVFYKFVIEKDQEVLLSTTVEKVLTTDKKFYVSQTEDALATFRYVDDVAISLVKDYDAKTFVFTWSDTNNIVATGILEVYRSNTMGTNLISHQSASSAAGTLTYTIVEPTDGNSYRANAYIASTGTYSLEQVLTDNMFYGTKLSDRFGTSALLPILLLLVSVGAAFIEFGGATGIIGGSLAVMIGGFFVGLIPISWVSITSLIIIGAILIAKMRA